MLKETTSGSKTWPVTADKLSQQNSENLSLCFQTLIHFFCFIKFLQLAAPPPAAAAAAAEAAAAAAAAATMQIKPSL